MNEQLYNLLFGLAAAFLLPLICYVLGMIWSKLTGGWKDVKFRKWWTTFCLALPFVFFGMMAKRMAEDHFEGLLVSWSTDRFPLTLVMSLGALLSAGVVVAIVRLWRASQS